MQCCSIDIFDMEPQINGLSFCVPTNGWDVEKTSISIDSIFRTMEGCEIPFEVIVVGLIEGFRDSKRNLVLVDEGKLAKDGYLSRLRNIAASNAAHDVLVFADDDIVFPYDWTKKLVTFCESNQWQVLGNRVLLPDGSRYWDRAIIDPHQMVEYDHPANDVNLYQCGCFWIVKRKVFEKEKWDESIKYYGKGGNELNEDVEYSRRLIENGYDLVFDKRNLVWHWDDRYTEWYTENDGLRCMKKSEISRIYKINQFPPTRPQFSQLIDELKG